MRHTLWIALLLCTAGCMQLHDGWLGRDQPRPRGDAGAADAGDAGMDEPEDEGDDEEEEENDQQDFTGDAAQR
jgi:hypothetical protein